MKNSAQIKKTPVIKSQSVSSPKTITNNKTVSSSKKTPIFLQNISNDSRAVSSTSKSGQQKTAAISQNAKNAKSKAANSAKKAEKKSPASPAKDPDFQSVKRKSIKEAGKQKKHDLAETKASDAQMAAAAPENEVENIAKGQQVGKIDEQDAKEFDRKAFKDALLKRIESITPNNLEEADEFKESGKSANLKNDVIAQVKQGKEDSQDEIKETTDEAPDTAGIEPKKVVEMPLTLAGDAPANIKASRAAPKRKTQSETSMQAGSDSLDQQMLENGLSEMQLTEANQPEFSAAVESKNQAQKNAVEAPKLYRGEEKAVLGSAKARAVGFEKENSADMFSNRKALLGGVVENQGKTKTSDTQTQKKVREKVKGFYDQAKIDVDAGLAQLDIDVNTIFDKGATAASNTFATYVDDRMREYKRERYSGAGGAVLWAKDKVFEIPSYVNRFYADGRRTYLSDMDDVIDDVATAVETGLAAIKKIVKKSREDIAEFVDKLPDDLKEVGELAAENIQSKFDSLEQSINDKQSKLIDSLAKKYVDNLNKIDKKIEKLKEANKGLVSKAKDAVAGTVNTVKELTNMLLNVLAKVASVVGSIIKAPIRFLGNLVRGVGQGLRKFMNNIGKHLKKGLMGWLFGAVAGAGITLPDKFDFKGIVNLLLQVLGLTKKNFRARAVKAIGENTVQRMEKTAEIFRIVMTEGVAGLWKWIKEKFVAIKEAVIDGIMSFVKERIIIAGITWIIGLLNPAAAFIKACKMIYDIVMFFVNRGKQIMSLVNAVLDSMAAIVSGKVGVAATAVEKALSKSLPVAISFLASLLGLGGISAKIREIMERVQRPVNRVIDWVIKKAVKMVGKVLGKGDKKKDDKKQLGDLGDLNAPPVVLPRTKAEEKEHVKAASLATMKLSKSASVKSTKDLAAYFPLIKKRYRLKQIKFVKNAGGGVNLFISINPEISDEIKEYMSGTGLDGTATKVAWETKKLGESTVGIKMDAKRLGPDHKQGTGPKDSALSSVMNKLVTDPGEDGENKYIKGHLLNDNVGGPGLAENLFPITADANAKHKTIESKVKYWVNEKKYWVSYSVVVKGINSVLKNTKQNNKVNSVLECKAAILSTDGKTKYDTITQNVVSKFREVGESGKKTATLVESTSKPTVSQQAKKMKVKESSRKSDQKDDFDRDLAKLIKSKRRQFKAAISDPNLPLDVEGMSTRSWELLYDFYIFTKGGTKLNISSNLKGDDGRMFSRLMSVENKKAIMEEIKKL